MVRGNRIPRCGSPDPADAPSHQFEAAINRYQAYIESRPADVGAYINIGVALAQVGRPADAVRAFERALVLDPKNETARNNIAIAQQAVGR